MDIIISTVGTSPSLGSGTRDRRRFFSCWPVVPSPLPHTPSSLHTCTPCAACVAIVSYPEILTR